MKEAIQKLKENDIVVFCAKTVFYLAILLILVYLYDYTNTDSGNFIYNEF
ncbi:MULTISPECIES: teichoic acid D-Ala incorporation-associated protein DltX [Carnobacterium]|uniref:Teichoic acid D-Ala incorporation-associated protein DltX n=1 Tax=Carnobacterium divergens TaxID=2748 RepID=A0A2R8A2F8_CARDV|nr:MULTISPECIES: teichoic acid D-Ala incorporation-associated protein DltX [Carnobacterium]MCO6017233.1 teichoic acid D-Ala incorporation-associated protein DltX [Carnobacterium divergens]MDT1939352.1 teichoic acid D-Ala incorporation-associated protein DltX [Carnobacterium divergens]MDT1941790.1 teichoic acid D-Ala incorporation-associated protein DltX [Carnobacterium divergens]MDT1947588.1 teichoic acid D-Ala incorporation-associated protein DltX [Carnobacterium divergens]MDT1950027.1 teicho